MSERSPLLRACEEVTRSRALFARLDALRDVSALFVDMPRCLALLDAPLPVPAFS